MSSISRALAEGTSLKVGPFSPAFSFLLSPPASATGKMLVKEAETALSGL